MPPSAHSARSFKPVALLKRYPFAAALATLVLLAGTTFAVSVLTNEKPKQTATKKTVSSQLANQPAPQPSIIFAANPTSVKSGAASTLTWTTENATACTASDGWNGAKPASGTESTGALTAAKNYVLTCDGPGGSVSAAAGVAITAPTVPKPTTSSGGSINSGVAAGSVLSYTTQQFVCNRPLSSYGKLPIKVIVHPPVGHSYNHNGAVDLTTGCAGDGNPNTIDLIVDVRGDGRTYGPGIDALKVRLQAGYNGGIQVTGTVNCGPRLGGAHQDGVQAQGGRDITFVDFNVGNYDAGLSTCQGAGGVMFYSAAGGTQPQNMNVIRGKYIGCNHALLAGTGTGQVSNAFFRSGRTDGSDPVCVGYAASNPCIDQSAVTLVGNSCQRWSGGRWQ